MPLKINLSGKTFNRLKILSESSKRDKSGNIYWNCQCECGKLVKVASNHLRTNHTQSCGCLNKELVYKRQFIDLIGNRFTRLIVIKKSNYQKGGSILWECLCDCGKTVVVTSNGLRTGNNKSCGCYKDFLSTQRRREKHPNWNPNKTDEERMKYRQIDTPLYTGWRNGIFKRDGFKCKICDKKGFLNAHHLDGWSWALFLRYEISNGITLCGGKGGCHNKFHKQYGKGKNTKYQFYEFMMAETGKDLYDLEL